MKIGLLISALIVCAANAVYADKYFVSSAAEVTIQMQTVQPGDTLIMTNGVWQNQRIVFTGDGQVGNPIVLQAETQGHVILTGASNLRIAGSHLVVDGIRFTGGHSPSGAVIEFRNGSLHATHSRLTNSAIVDFNPDSNSRDYKWVSLYGSNNRVDHCHFEGKTHSGTTLVVWLSNQPNFHRIDNNYFGHRPPLGVNGGETIRVGTSDWSMFDSFTTVEWNYFERCNGEVEIISNKSGNNIFRYNTFYESEGALTLRHGNAATVEGNFFIGNRKPDTGGVRVIGEDHKVINNYFEGLYGSSLKSALPIMNGVPNSPLNRYFQVKNAVVAFNTFVDCRYTMILGAGSDSERTLPPENCVIANNLVKTTHDIITQEDAPINLMWEGNIMHGGDLGIPQPAGITLVDPQLVVAADGLWRPHSSSPALDAAVGDYGFVMDDLDGQPRDSSKDVGADENSQEIVLRQPLTAEDVGPDWLKTGVPHFLAITTIGAGQVLTDPAMTVFEHDAVVTLTVIPDSGWVFMGWQGDLTGSDTSLVITVNEDKEITAVFAETIYDLSILVFSSGGTVELNPPGGRYDAGTVVSVTAVPDAGWEFVSWGGSLSGSANPESITINRNESVLATFARITTDVAKSAGPTEYELGQNYPNPFVGGTTIPFSLEQPGETTIEVFSLSGRKVATVVNQHLAPAAYRVFWQAPRLAAGTYYYRMRSGDFISTHRMILVK